MQLQVLQEVTTIFQSQFDPEVVRVGFCWLAWLVLLFGPRTYHLNDHYSSFPEIKSTECVCFVLICIPFVKVR